MQLSGNTSQFLEQADEETDIYRVRTEIMYLDDDYEAPGIEDALVSEVDGERQILLVYGYE